MPEGPEIRIAADRVADAVVGKRVHRVYFAFDRLKCHERRLEGRRVQAIETRGKAMLIRFAGGPTIYSHNQLYGRWFVRRAGEFPSTRRSLRLALHNHEHSALLYSASQIEVLDEAELATHPFLAKIGPDVLHPRLQPHAIARRLQEKRFCNRQLGALLLDQTFLAGIGNYLRSEILFVARLHPVARPRDLSAEQRRDLARAIRSIARRAYRKRGVTTDARHVAAQRRAGARRRHYRHYVFARAGQPCHDCGKRVVKLAVGGRRCYVCPSCQKR
jgi:endonuclease-8